MQQPPDHACTGGRVHPLPALGCAGRPAVDQQLQLSLRLTPSAAPTATQGALEHKIKGPLRGGGCLEREDEEGETRWDLML